MTAHKEYLYEWLGVIDASPETKPDILYENEATPPCASGEPSIYVVKTPEGIDFIRVFNIGINVHLSVDKQIDTSSWNKPTGSYNRGHAQGYQKGHDVGYAQGQHDAYADCGVDEEERA